jgi:catechol 2,3-dioxygenase-like lactoylglutathione lyase family enzyme
MRSGQQTVHNSDGRGVDMPPTIDGVLETALHVEDLGRSIKFYRNVFGLEILHADERFCAFNVSNRQVLLLFKRGASTAPLVTPCGVIPPHDGDGRMHFAFAISAAELAPWESWLQEKGIAIESTVHWERGGTSLYFRDPDGHLVELATPGIWAIY